MYPPFFQKQQRIDEDENEKLPQQYDEDDFPTLGGDSQGKAKKIFVPYDNYSDEQ